MAKGQRKVNFDHVEEEQEQKAKNIRKRTLYNIDQEKLNLVEVRRKINKQNLRFDPKTQHLKELHNLEKTRREAKQEIHQKMQEEVEKELKKLEFKPQIDEKSKKLAEKKEPNLITRQEEWLKMKNEKVEHKKQLMEKKLLEKEMHSTQPLPKPKNNY